MYLMNPPPAINAQRIGVRFSLKKIGKRDVVTVLNRPPLKGATPFRIISQECSRMTYFVIQRYQYDWFLYHWLHFILSYTWKYFWIDSNYTLTISIDVATDPPRIVPIPTSQSAMKNATRITAPDIGLFTKQVCQRKINVVGYDRACMLSSKRIIFCNICVEQSSDDMVLLTALKTDLRHILTWNRIFLFIGKNNSSKYIFFAIIWYLTITLQNNMHTCAIQRKNIFR